MKDWDSLQRDIKSLLSEPIQKKITKAPVGHVRTIPRDPYREPRLRIGPYPYVPFWSQYVGFYDTSDISLEKTLPSTIVHLYGPPSAREAIPYLSHQDALIVLHSHACGSACPWLGECHTLSAYGFCVPYPENPLPVRLRNMWKDFYEELRSTGYLEPLEKEVRDQGVPSQ